MNYPPEPETLKVNKDEKDREPPSLHGAVMAEDGQPIIIEFLSNGVMRVHSSKVTMFDLEKAQQNTLTNYIGEANVYFRAFNKQNAKNPA